MSQTPDINCRICGMGFEDFEISPVLKPVTCSNCNAPAEIFNGVIIQDNGIDYFDVFGDINTCKLCGLYPEVALLPPNNEGFAFGFFCTHQETSEEESDYLLVDNQNLETARIDWNKLNGLEAQCQ